MSALYYNCGGDVLDFHNAEIGLRIRKLRESQKLSREKLAELSSISTQFLADIETGKKGMTVATLKKICISLNTSADFIVFGETDCDLKSISLLMAEFDENKQNKLKSIFKEIVDL